MISPDQIRAKALRFYPRAVAHWLSESNDLFPYRMPCNLEPAASISETIRQVEELRSKSKEQVESGYRVEWEYIRSRTHGANQFPSAIVIDSFDDLIALCQKKSEFQKLRRSVHALRERLPALKPWIETHWRKLLEVEALPDLIQVTEYVLAHPRPGCFVRELPVPVPTKLVQKYRQLLSGWWELLLPQHAIDLDCDPTHFEQRYGFRQAREHVLIRILDDQLQRELSIPFSEVSLDPRQISQIPVRDVRVLIVENKVNLLTLPSWRQGIALGGLGAGVNRLFEIEWLRSQRLWYWGDMDAEGFEILARLRRSLPQAQSLLMNEETWRHHAALVCPKPLSRRRPMNLDLVDFLRDAERSVYQICCEQGLWLEQEHIPPSDVVAALAREESL